MGTNNDAQVGYNVTPPSATNQFATKADVNAVAAVAMTQPQVMARQAFGGF